MTPTTTPALIRASFIRDFLAAALGGGVAIPSHYTVSSIGIYNNVTGELTECDTTEFYDAVGADVGENITIEGTKFGITRYGIIHNDLS